jgi:hypothetical protein
MTNCRFVKQSNLEGSFQFCIRPNSLPTNFQDFSSEGIVVLIQALEYPEEWLLVLLQE